MSHSIRFKDSLTSNKTVKNRLKSLFFLHGDNHQGKVAFKATTRGWVWPGVSLGEADSKIL